MDFAASIGINLLSALMWLMIGAIALHLFKFLMVRKANAFSKVSGITRAARAVHLVYGLVDIRGNGSHYSLDEGDVCALCLALSFLEAKYDPKKVFVINSQAARTNLASYSDVVSISGPIWNDISSYFLETITLPAKFSTANMEDGTISDTLVVSTTGANKAYLTSYNDGVPRECYALVVSGPVSAVRGDKRSQNVVVAAGISALGTYGAVYWLKSLSDAKPKVLSDKAKDTMSIKVFVLKICDNSPKGFRAYAADNSNPGYLSFEVIHELKCSPYPSNTM